MGSRRLMNRSLSGDGRYYHSGNDFTSQNSRGDCRSYLNSRNTLCSVMAQLTEETQPTFETTLKSKAVSEATNVKFFCMVSGHPAPHVTWYKDDEQLDRYCGLPKYEISCDGKSHTLHIYNCSLEDAAIYQASAQNSRGIVSCSGVLEVGTMNEFKIHQNYFAKLKQRNENRRREQERSRYPDKEKVPAALEMSSPERTQRKRRSPMETTSSLSSTNSSDDKEEPNALAQTSSEEIQTASPILEAASAHVHSLSDSEMIVDRDKDSQRFSYVHKTVQETSSQQTTKQHFAKKKIKISTDRSKENRQNVQEEMSDMDKKNKQEQSTVAQNGSVTKLRNKMDTKDDTKPHEKPFVKARGGVTELKKTPVPQKPTVTLRRPALKVATATNAEVVENTKQIESSDKQKAVDRRSSLVKSHSQRWAPNTKQGVPNQRAEKCNPSSPGSELMAIDDNKTKPALVTCVRIQPHSCGEADVNTDTGDRNVSAGPLRTPNAGDTRADPKEATICGNVPSFQRDVANTRSTLGSCHLTSQEQKENTGDQSMGLTENSTPLVTGHDQLDTKSPHVGERISSAHVSHTLQDGRVTTVMNSSSGDDMLTKMSEKDHMNRLTDNLMIKRESEKTKGKIKSETTTLNGMEANETKTNINMNKVEKNIAKDQPAANTKHSISLVTEFVQVRSNLTSMSNPSEVVQSQTTNGSSTSKVLMKHKMDVQEQGTSNLITSEAPHGENQSHTANIEIQRSSTNAIIGAEDKNNENPKVSHCDPSTFLSQHSKTMPSNFIIPAIYITDVDSTSQNNKTEISDSKLETETSVTNGVDHADNNFELEDVNNKPTTALESEDLSKVGLSQNSPNDINQFTQQPLSEENMRKTDIQRLKNYHPTVASDCKSIKTNESDLGETKCLTFSAKPGLNLKTESDSFIKQLKTAALDLERSRQSSTTDVSQDTPHVKVQQGQAMPAVIQPKDSESVTRAHQKTTLPNTTTKQGDFGVSMCFKEPNKDEYKEETGSVISQPAFSSQTVSNSPYQTSVEKSDLSKPKENEKLKTKSPDRDKENQFKVPQVIRKIRPEVFDTSGHLKLWCQFFNILSDSIIKWFKDDVEIAEINRSPGDETQLFLAIVQTFKRDCGVYRCTITNEYGQDSTEYNLTTETISSMFLHEEIQEVGEEIEMTPLIFSRGLADAGSWGSKFYGRVTTEEAQVGTGCRHKTRRLRVIYGLEPVFESGASCLMKIRSPIAYESREETVLAEKNLQMTKQDCRIQNMAREYFKIFATETREIESFGSALEIIPLYFMYRPASSVPYATVEVELKGLYLRYCGLDHNGSMVFNNRSDVAQKCSSLQHWIYQWTNGNVLFSRLEGVDTILTNIGVVTKSKGYQGFPCEADAKIFEQFQTQHQCNYFCGLLNLKPPAVPEAPQTGRYRGSSSPQAQRRATRSPKVSRRLNHQTST